MRIKVLLRPVKVMKININYNYFLSSLCYKLLDKSNKDFAKMLHEDGFEAGEKRFKLFTFSQLICKNANIDGTYITFNDVVTWYIGSPVKDFILYFGEAIMQENYIYINNAEFEVLNVEVLEPISFENSLKLKCLSPVCVNTGEIVDGEFKSYYLSLDDERFKENLKNNLIKKYFALNKKLPKNMNLDIKFHNIDRYLRGKRINVKNSFIKGYMPIFEISGSEELIKIGYDAGFGCKNSMGCGMVQKI